MLACLGKELELKSAKWPHKLDTIYLGGGTPSILSKQELTTLLDSVYRHFECVSNPEITLEANPEDLSASTAEHFLSVGINRISIGIQTFLDDQLRRLNRGHSGEQGMASVAAARQAGLTNISVDLMFGLPGSSQMDWEDDLDKLIELNVPHASIYGLIIETKTAFGRWAAKGQIAIPDEDIQAICFRTAHQRLTAAGFDHYEVSNYARSGYMARHNTSYWKQVPFLGIGPGAHSFDGNSRAYNVRSNPAYIRAIKEGKIPEKQETLSRIQQVNEYIMTRVRTNFGLDLASMGKVYDIDLLADKRTELNKLLRKGLLISSEDRLKTTAEGLLFADEIALELFYEE